MESILPIKGIFHQFNKVTRLDLAATQSWLASEPDFQTQNADWPIV